MGQKKKANSALTFIDLFSGCGGFSLGLERAGFSCLAAIDSDRVAVDTFRANFPRVRHVLERDLTSFLPAHLDAVLDRQRVDVIIGGPPCQGFSKARHVDGSNHGKRLVADPRRYLYRNFLSYVAYYQPRVFVMENVPGLRWAAGGEFFAKVQSEARALGYRVHSEEVESWRFGVPQKRVRQLIVGTRRELPLFVGSRYLKRTHVLAGEPAAATLQSATSLWEAIGDLPPLRSAEGQYQSSYDYARQCIQLARYGERYLLNVLQIHRAKKLTSHC